MKIKNLNVTYHSSLFTLKTFLAFITLFKKIHEMNKMKITVQDTDNEEQIYLIFCNSKKSRSSYLNICEWWTGVGVKPWWTWFSNITL